MSLRSQRRSSGPLSPKISATPDFQAGVDLTESQAALHQEKKRGAQRQAERREIAAEKPLRSGCAVVHDDSPIARRYRSSQLGHCAVESHTRLAAAAALLPLRSPPTTVTGSRSDETARRPNRKAAGPATAASSLLLRAGLLLDELGRVQQLREISASEQQGEGGGRGCAADPSEWRRLQLEEW